MKLRILLPTIVHNTPNRWQQKMKSIYFWSMGAVTMDHWPSNARQGRQLAQNVTKQRGFKFGLAKKEYCFGLVTVLAFSEQTMHMRRHVNDEISYRLLYLKNAASKDVCINSFKMSLLNHHTSLHSCFTWPTACVYNLTSAKDICLPQAINADYACFILKFLHTALPVGIIFILRSLKTQMSVACAAYILSAMLSLNFIFNFRLLWY
jgi:hypothetical protein